MIAPESRPRQSPRILSQRAAETVVLLDPDGGDYYSLAEAGGEIWELCDGGHSLAEIAAVISEAYDAPAAVVQQDVLELVGDLAAAGLVRIEG